MRGADQPETESSIEYRMSFLLPEGNEGGVYSQARCTYILLFVWTQRDVILLGDKHPAGLYPQQWYPLRSTDCQMCGLSRAERLHFIRVDEGGGALAIPHSANSVMMPDVDIAYDI